MAAYQPQPGMHPGMAPHGHPGMTPGQPMNPAQMQQMGHPGASGPGAPHVSQPGAMMGMQPGANAMGGNAGMGGQHPGGQMGGMPGQMGAQSMAGGAPNAQALSHMNPQAMMQQQHMQQQSKYFRFQRVYFVIVPKPDAGPRKAPKAFFERQSTCRLSSQRSSRASKHILPRILTANDGAVTSPWSLGYAPMEYYTNNCPTHHNATRRVSPRSPTRLENPRRSVRNAHPSNLAAPRGWRRGRSSVRLFSCRRWNLFPRRHQPSPR